MLNEEKLEGRKFANDDRGLVGKCRKVQEASDLKEREREGDDWYAGHVLQCIRELTKRRALSPGQEAGRVGPEDCCYR